MTIGIGFRCDKGIVLCADTQITHPQNHKYYEHKIFVEPFADGLMAFTYAGSPSLAKMFKGKFAAGLKLLPAPITVEKVHDLVETILSLMDVIDTDPSGLYMLCAIGLTSGELRLLKTDLKAVNEVNKFDYVGVGDSSLLRFLAPLLTETREYTIGQAVNVGVGLVLQAKRYVDGCGGDTDTVIVTPRGQTVSSRGPHWQEQKFLLLEHFLKVAFTDLFNDQRTVEEFVDSVDRLAKALKDYRPELQRSV